MSDLKQFLLSSSIFVDRRPFEVVTILGSCISVCLWDSVLQYGGMNHYMLPLWNGEGLATPKFGNIAIEKLIGKMLELGSKRKNLQAKIFGGAELFAEKPIHTYKIGEMNVRVAMDLLRKEQIPILNFSVGGNKGRKIVFITKTGEVYMKYLSDEPTLVILPN